jgi:serine protease Do
MKALKIKHIVIALVIVLTLLVSSCSLLNNNGSLPSDSVPPGTGTPIDPGWTPPTTGDDSLVTLTIADVVDLVRPSVVAINVEITSYDLFNRPYTQQGAGSGWIIDEDGIIVTNNHVVEGAQSVTVTLADGRTFPATSIRTDSLSDLAVVEINASGLPAAKVGSSGALRVGDWVVAIGNSLGLGISATKGIVSAQNVSLPVSAGQTLDDLIQTDAAINPGNSGGPLVNLAGEVIGITSLKVSQVGVEGMGYAISIDSAMPIIEDLIQSGYVTRPWLGVGLYTVDEFAIMTYDLAVDEGALITQLVAGSPADEAGLQEGDVITYFDGEAITTAEELIQAIHSKEIGQHVEIVFWRGDTKNTVYATLVESPAPS